MEVLANQAEHLLDLRKIPRFQGTSGLVPMVLSDRDVSVDTSREEKQLVVDQIWSGDGGALRKPSLYQEQAELRQHYDLQTQFAELVDGNMRTSFELRFNGSDLIGEDGRSMNKVTHDALDEAKEVAKADLNLWFEVRRRSYERDELHELIDMAYGEQPNTMVVVSDFPPELMGAARDVGGYNVRRKQTMLRVLAHKPDGNIQMYSQSLDGSNRTALEAIYASFGIKPKTGELLGQRISAELSPDQQTTLIDELTGTYDKSLVAQYGGEWYAGRRPADYSNTYDFVCGQHDLIEECVRLQNLGWFNDKMMYKISAAMQRRFKAAQQGTIGIMPHLAAIDPAVLHREIESAGAQARQTGMSFSACGVTLRAEGLDGSTKDQLDLAGYGNKSREDKYGSLTFKCQKGHTNTRPHNKLIERCKTCGINVRC